MPKDTLLVEWEPPLRCEIGRDARTLGDAVLHGCRRSPIVFANVTDPVANGIVPRLQSATTTIPIVFSVGNDPIKATRRHSACYTPRPGAPLAKLLFRPVSR